MADETPDVDSDVDGHSIFAYGSLISPLSIVSRTRNPSPAIEAVYDSETDAPLIRRDELEAWWEVSDRIDVVPVRVRGFRRHYSMESPRGGTMLDVRYTGDESDVINGTIIRGLTDEEFEIVGRTESPYELRTYDPPAIEPYPSEAQLASRGFDVPEEIQTYVYAPDAIPEGPKPAKNDVYHARLMAGIGLLGELYDAALSRQFREAFLRTTAEWDDSSGAFVPVYEVDGIPLEETEEVEAVCDTISAFHDTSWDNDLDKLSNWVILPEELLDRLGIEEYDYVDIRAADVTDEKYTRSLLAASFASYHPSEYHRTDDGRHKICIRTNLQNEIGCSVEEGNSRVVISPSAVSSRTMTVRRETSHTQQQKRGYIDHDVCHIHRDFFESDEVDIDIEPGEYIEAINRTNGRRIQLRAKKYVQRQFDKDDIRLHNDIAALLDVSPVDVDATRSTVKIRPTSALESNPERTLRRRFTEELGERFVDYNAMHVRVLPGYEQDERRNIVRLDRTVIEQLGIDPGDRVVLTWRDESVTAKCLPPLDRDERIVTPADGDDHLLRIVDRNDTHPEVFIPSTERDKVDMSVNDSVEVRRDMKYTFGKNVVVSIFSILAVLVGIQQLATMQFPNATLVELLGFSIPSVVVVLYAVLWTERQKCYVE
ncbi:AbrB/MazE/SpoVT family DNA-binding domain-containing protein [Halobellus rarus]|uniref:Uncharacterized protein n=1 Tax=Halobellus rarus TaxID=1126237 RepID=A0ABD6CJ34_9EURY|nr:hypothetical protein [Halobellus rarus]